MSMLGRGKFLGQDVSRLYAKAYKEKFAWHKILDKSLLEYLEILQGAKGCPVTLAMSSLLPTVSMSLGPNTKFDSGLGESVCNIFSLAICDPGGGKSATHENIMLDAFNNIGEIIGISPAVEVYTTAGMQTHQCKTGGYGIITSDEGHRILASINSKQLKNEGEHALLCKLWMGKGDYACLASEESRGFAATSLSMCIFIQPEPLLNEMLSFKENDGLLDRFLFFTERPKPQKSEIIRENRTKLKQNYKENLITQVIMSVFHGHHNKNVCYSFTQRAQNYFDKLVDEYAEMLNKKYDSSLSSDEDIILSQESALRDKFEDSTPPCSSKDLAHIGRLSVVLHNLLIGFKHVIATDNPLTMTVQEKIPIDVLKAAHMMYINSSNQKHIILQGVKSASCQATSSLRIGSSQTPRQRIKKSICRSLGPVVLVSSLNRNLKGIKADLIRDELKTLTEQETGQYMTKDDNKMIKADLYFKPHPGSLQNNGIFLVQAQCTIDYYTAKYNDHSKLQVSSKVMKLCNFFEAMDVTLSEDESLFGSQVSQTSSNSIAIPSQSSVTNMYEDITTNTDLTATSEMLDGLKKFQNITDNEGKSLPLGSGQGNSNNTSIVDKFKSIRKTLKRNVTTRKTLYHAAPVKMHKSSKLRSDVDSVDTPPQRRKSKRNKTN